MISGHKRPTVVRIVQAILGRSVSTIPSEY